MVIWRNVIKNGFRALLPIAIIPAFLISLIIYRFRLTLDAVLIIVMLAQFYIILTQVEVSLRQARLNEFRYEPIIFIKLKEIKIKKERAYNILLMNAGEYPAYNVLITTHSQPLFSRERTRIVGSIEPTAKELLFSLSKREFDKYSEFSLNINYTNALGKDGRVTFNFPMKFMPHVFTIHGDIKMPGILLNSIEDLRLIFSLLTMDRRIKKMGEKLKKES